MVFDIALPHDRENPVVVAEFGTRLEADKWPENIGLVGESSRVFILKAEDLVDLLFGSNGPSVDWPENMLSVSGLARIYFIIV